MQIGIHHNITNREYHKAPGISNTGISHLVRSPAHYQAYLKEPSKDTQAMRLGRLAHEIILEPDNFKYAIAPTVDKRTKSGKAEWAEFEAENAGKHILTQDEYDVLSAMKDSVYGHPAANGALTSFPGHAEVSVCGYINGEPSGELCKVRPDWWRDDNIIVDLKTTEDASPDGFAKSCYNYGYHRQAAFYLDLCSSMKKVEQLGFIFVAIEKKPPYAVAVYEASAEMIEYGRMEYQRALMTLAECKISKKWQGYSEGVQEIGLPGWAKRKIEGDN